MLNFTWIPFYRELSEKVLDDKLNDGKNILNTLNKAFANYKLNNNVSNFLGIDPFTFFARFNNDNKAISKDSVRINLLSEIKKSLSMTTSVPSDFLGIPTYNFMQNWSASGEVKDKPKRDVLWNLYENAIHYADSNSDELEFIKNFNIAINYKWVKNNITFTLFYIRPNCFIALDKKNQELLKKQGYLNSFIFDGKSYLDLCRSLISKGLSFPQFSLEAEQMAKGTNGIVNSNTVNLHIDEFQNKLIKMHNIIFRGAPGTGKTYLAKQLATYVVSNGRTIKYDELSEDEIRQIEFVQFHPSYDYTDFVEGLRPQVDDEKMNFELKDGVFKAFCKRAMSPYSIDDIRPIFDKSWNNLIHVIKNKSNYDFVKKGKKYRLELNVGKEGIKVSKGNDKDSIYKPMDGVYINSGQVFNIYIGNPGVPKKGHDTYRRYVLEELKENFDLVDIEDVDLSVNHNAKTTSNGEKHINTVDINDKKYVFIIDEINRGEISKIFGELFFSIDPGYRGEEGGVLTQYSNMHKNPYEQFYVPENVYIIGTMNDIDRSVDTFDFAIRRRFAFIPITAKDSQIMLTDDKLKNRMNNLNNAIIEISELNENYKIGASYFRRVENNELDIEELWDYYLEPLLRDYLQGMDDIESKINTLKSAYKDENILNDKNNNISKSDNSDDNSN